MHDVGTRSRLIPVLLLDGEKRLVKTIGFGERTYIGDPFNVVRLFNEKEVDEICVLDIDATRENRPPDAGFLAELASECFMPLAYGGGIASIEHCEGLIRLGIEKLVVGSRRYDTALLRAASTAFGSQAVVACIDVRRGADGEWRSFVRNGSSCVAGGILDHVRALEAAGVGEIIVQSIDRDGARQGFDLDLVRLVGRAGTVPVVALGGGGDVSHLLGAIASGASAAASGSAFCFIGRLRAVLVSYPEPFVLEQSAVTTP